MNNSSFQPEPVTPDQRHQEREAWLVRMIEAATSLLESREWSSLTEIFDGWRERLERDLERESKQFPISPDKMYYIQGQLSQEKKHDLVALVEIWRKELANVRNLLSPERGGDGSLNGL